MDICIRPVGERQITFLYPRQLLHPSALQTSFETALGTQGDDSASRCDLSEDAPKNRPRPGSSIIRSSVASQPALTYPRDESCLQHYATSVFDRHRTGTSPLTTF